MQPTTTTTTLMTTRRHTLRALGTLALAALVAGVATVTPLPAHAAPARQPQPQCMQLGTMIQCMGPGGMTQQSGSMVQGTGPGGSVQQSGNMVQGIGPAGTFQGVVPPGTPAPAPAAPAAPVLPTIPFPAFAPLQIQNGEAMPALPTDVPLAIGVARGEGGTYRLGESLNVAYAVNKPLVIRVIAVQNGVATTLLEGSGDGTLGQVGAVAGPATGPQTFKIVGLASDGSVVEASVTITVVN